MSSDGLEFAGGALIGAFVEGWSLVRHTLLSRWMARQAMQRGPVGRGWPGAIFGLVTYVAGVTLVFVLWGTPAAFAGLVVGAVVPRYVWMFTVRRRKGE